MHDELQPPVASKPCLTPCILRINMHPCVKRALAASVITCKPSFDVRLKTDDQATQGSVYTVPERE